MDATAQNDMALLQRYATSGDAAAMAELIRRYAGLVFGVAKRITRDPHDAEDVAQSCFLELLRRASDLPEARAAQGAAGSAAGWIHSTAVHRALDTLRNEGSRRRHERAAAHRRQEAAESERWWEDLSPVVDSAIETLPAEFKTPLILHFLQGQTQAQIATTLAISQPTVSRRLETGVEILRRKLRELELGAACAALPLLLVQHAPTLAPQTLTAALGKMAVAGVGTQALAFPTPPAIPLGIGAKFLGGTYALYALLAIGTLIAAGWVGLHFFGDGVPKPRTVSIAAPVAAAKVETEHQDDNGHVLSGSATLRCTSVTRSADWYRDRLGFTINSPDQVSRGEYRITFTTIPNATAQATAPLEEKDDVDELYAELKQRQAPVTAAPMSSAGGPYRFSVTDPDGNVLTFEEQRPVEPARTPPSQGL